MSSAITPFFATAATLVLLAGVSKLRSPGTTRVALAAIGWRTGSLTARLIGAGEVALGLVCLGSPSPASALCLAAAYLAFATVIWLMLRTDDQVPCGCFGVASFRPSALHGFADLLAAAVCLLAAAAGAPSVVSGAGRGLPAVVVLLGVVGAAYLCFLGFVLLPELWSAHQGGGEAA